MRPRPRNRAASAAGRRPCRRWRRGLSTLLIAGGLLLLLDAAVTLLWQEPVSAIRAGFAQRRLAADLRRLDAAAQRGARDERRRRALLAGRMRAGLRDGQAVARLRIPRIGLDDVVVAGTSAADLREGPGLYEESPLPGVPGTVAIAGHRTTYGAPFRHIDALRRGDAIRLELPYGTFTYRVASTRVVAPSDVAAVRAHGHGARVVLTACTPLFSAAQRLVVSARLSGYAPARTSVRAG
jgi:sortase A